MKKDYAPKNKKVAILVTLAIAILFLSSNLIFMVKRENREEVLEKNLFQNSPEREEKIKQNLANTKVFFTKNEGQLQNDDIYFTYTAQEKSFGFAESSCLVKLSKRLEDNRTKSSVIEIIFEGSNKVTPVGVEKLKHKSNYFLGNDSSKWKTDVPNYQKIVYENIYEGIDLVYYFNEKGLKYDWIVGPNANPNEIVERFEGIDSVNLDSSGRLIIKTETGELKEEKPYGYQEICGNIVGVDVSFRVVGKRLIYEIEDYETSRDLIIDPLIYSTFIGEADEDWGWRITLDSKNNAYITGDTSSPDFPTTPSCFNDSHSGEYDVFVCKLNQDGSDLVYSTFVGGEEYDGACGIALDSGNNVYITGNTHSLEFPTTSGCFDDSGDEWGETYVFKLNQDGSDLVYSTFVGGSENDYGWGVAVDSKNNAYVTGYTESTDFPTTSGSFGESYNGGNWDVFVFKLNQDGSDLVYSTYVGGAYSDWGYALVIDPQNNAYITGETESSDFPNTTGSTHNGNWDFFVLKLNKYGSYLVYSTFIGGDRDDG